MFNFGEEVQDYNYKVLNEREVRASAGIMFLLGVISLFTITPSQSVIYVELFAITFILEFIVRMFNPKYAPYMVLGSLFVSNQNPEWVEANPKKFAWFLGLLLGLLMLLFITIDFIGPIRMLLCLMCLSLLYIESVFGVCLGCLMYKKFNKKLNNCAGGICEIKPKKKKDWRKIVSLTLFLVFGFVVYEVLKNKEMNKENLMIKKLIEKNEISFEIKNKEQVEEKKNQQFLNIEKTNNKLKNSFLEKPKEIKENCNPPEWAIKIGHREMWIKHNCSNN